MGDDYHTDVTVADPSHCDWNARIRNNRDNIFA